MNKKRLTRIFIVLVVITLYLGIATKVELSRTATPLPNAGSASTTSLTSMPVDRAQLLGDVRTLSSPAFGGRKTGTNGNRKARDFVRARFKAIQLRAFGADYAQPFSFTHRSIKGLLLPGKPYKTAYPSATNLIGYFPGTVRPDRYIVISAHYDHLGMKSGKLYPGADDNASGVAAMLAIAAWFRSNPPLHSVVFVAFDGEEEGLRGAKAFMAAPPFPRSQLALNLNLDMVSRSDANEIFVAGIRYSPALMPLLAQVALNSMVNIRVGHDRPQWMTGLIEDWTHASDQGPFHDAGVPFLYVGVEDHPDYHAPGDTFEHVDQVFFGNVADMLVNLAAQLDQHLDTTIPAAGRK
ncbi:MAG: M20/M25/M40 family metallo-hydrolase [Thermomonas sp.]